MEEKKAPSHFKAVAHRYGLSEAVEGADEDMLCAICKNLPVQPKECRECRGVYCEQCISGYLEKNKKCPEECKECVLVKPHPYFLKGLQAVIVKCVWCGTQLSYKQLAGHECDQKQYECEICGEKVAGSERDTHRGKCNYFDCNKCEAKKCTQTHDCVAYLKQALEEEKKQSEERIKTELAAKEKLKTKLMETQGQLIELKMSKGVAGGDKSALKTQLDDLRQKIKWMTGHFDGKDHIALHCPKKHTMKKYRDLPPGYKHPVQCNQCKANHLEKYSQFFLHCGECKYDVCAKCFIAEIH